MRYLPHTEEEIRSMLQAIGVNTIESLFESIPKRDRLAGPLKLPPPLNEIELRQLLREISRKNAHGEEWASFLGGGAYSHYIPSAASHLIQRGEFLTAYTPYQPEVSQGTLQAIFEFQTMAAEILGMEIANASNYDGSTATAEAVLMALRLNERPKVLIGRSIHPEYRAVIETYLNNQRVQIETIPFGPEGTLDRNFLKRNIDDKTACVVAATPNFFGVVDDVTDVAENAHQHGALLITTTSEPLAFGLFRSPGEMGADIAVAEGQSFGNPVSLGGPSLGLFATLKKHARSVPGRLVGETTDQEGKRGFVLTLSTREQHIRRERATSNICTNVSLCALAATITLSLWGKQGFQKLAQTNYQNALELRERIKKIANLSSPFESTHFNEFVIRLPKVTSGVLKKLQKEKILGGVPLDALYPELENSLLICTTEMNSDDDRDRLVRALENL
ncbi:MAG: aminomethyl-transferring glycine dehydrogenase subunit GcvPA [Deltaproteobacteria bacterium]|nr:aminomethyl-transferring glycine dehydrogenase subunit GcvPA [Deltaproteobacteria bacterium]